MTDPVKPISNRTKSEKPIQQKPEELKKVRIGGIEFNRNEIEKTSSYTKDGKKMNSVFLKNGMQVDFPNQTNPDKSPTISSRGDGGFWGNDLPSLEAYDVENASIYGNKNKTDFINLSGKSSNNEVFVDEKESWYVNSEMRRDYVDLGPLSKNNTVHMDEKDRTDIWYNQMGVEVSGQVVQSELECLRVEGKGESAQEEQLKDALSEHKYTHHKIIQDMD